MERKNSGIPVFIHWVIRTFIDPEVQEEFLGDLQEVYLDRSVQKGRTYARLMLWMDTLHLLIGFLKIPFFRNQYFRSVMTLIEYNIQLSFRNLRTNRLFSVINIAGLTVGLTCSLMIFLWVWDEMRIDQFHQNGLNIVQILGDVDNNGESIVRKYAPSAMVQPIHETFPEITAIARVSEGQVVFQSGHARFTESGIYADSSFLKIFSFPLKEGNLQTIFSDPQSVVISDELAAKCFPGELAVGKRITIVDGQKLEYIVSGVLQPIPAQSSLQFDFIMSYDEFEAAHRPWWNGKSNVNAYTNFNVAVYASLVPETDVANLNARLETFIHDYTGLETTDAMFVFPFQELYLHDDFSAGRIPTGKKKYVNLMMIIAVLVLVVAIINFMNLATARAGKRAKEVGIRKVIGAPRIQLLGQFVTESVVIVTISMVLAFTVASMALPLFNFLTQKQVILPIHSWSFYLLILAITVGTGILAGWYPAFYLSAFSPTGMLKKASGQNSVSGFRNGLVITQFTLSIIFIVFTLVVSKQIRFIQEKDLGIAKANILQHPLHSIVTNSDAYRNQLLAIPGVRSVGFSEHNPTQVKNSNLGVSWDGKPANNVTYFNVMQVGRGMAETFALELRDGLFFEQHQPSDSMKYFMLNETAVRAMGIQNPLGLRMRVWGHEGIVSGIVKDFNHQALMQPIEPVVLIYNPQEIYTAFIGIEDVKDPGILLKILDVYEQYEQEYPFQYSFVEDEYNVIYHNIITIGWLSNVFAVVAIFISCLGLFGLSAYVGEQRTKETGIRKVLGASVVSLLKLFSGQFMILVFLAFMIAAPIAWFISNYWLSDFAFRIDPGIFPILLTGLVVLLIALITVGYNTLQAARTNPVDVLKDE